MFMLLGKIYEEAHADLFPFHLFMDQWGLKLSDKAGDNFKSSCAVFKNGGVQWLSNSEEQTQLSREVFSRLMSENFFETVDKNTRLLLKEMNEYIEQLKKIDFSKKSDSELVKIYVDYCNKVLELNSWGTLVTLMEMGHESIITNEVYEYLSKKGRELNLSEKVPESLSTLCTPVEPTFLREKTIETIKIAIKARKNGIESVQREIDKLHREFLWVSYGYVGPAIEREVFESGVKELAKRENLEKELQKIETEDKEVKKKQKELEKLFQLDDYGKKLFHVARTFMFQKEYRKQVLYHSFYVFSNVRKEIAKRSGLAMNELAYALPEEVEKILKHKFDVETLRQRRKLLVYIPIERKLLTGEEAGEFISKLKLVEVNENVAELKGQCACPGKVKGIAKIVFNAHDLKKLNEGDVLVSPATSPAMVPGMHLASAIITDQGGLTCHAGIVSRELKKPCVIGTKVATKVLKDGDVVEVDATNGIVRKV